MTPSTWLPDHPLGWVLLAVLGFALGLWAYLRLSAALFTLVGARRLARERGWLVKVGRSAYGDHDNLGWSGTAPPDTTLEILGQHHGRSFHVRERRVRVTRTSGHPGEPSYAWRYDYVATLATTARPPAEYVPEQSAGSCSDQRLALYPTFLNWESDIFSVLDSAERLPEHGLRSGSGLRSVEYRGRRLTRKRLFADLDMLLGPVHG
ncbi:hypothetical protein [Saccharomonospora iraqiensis]|uniref:hypothetical protein n=1 Tax=Saccharomonospora iraqiensis TaxID=52698 RepID=UPI00022E31E3|nr:hypothetical protein [Saccharomonospora iraqiensis]